MYVVLGLVILGAVVIIVQYCRSKSTIEISESGYLDPAATYRVTPLENVNYNPINASEISSATNTVPLNGSKRMTEFVNGSTDVPLESASDPSNEWEQITSRLQAASVQAASVNSPGRTQWLPWFQPSIEQQLPRASAPSQGMSANSSSTLPWISSAKHTSLPRIGASHANPAYESPGPHEEVV